MLHDSLQSVALGSEKMSRESPAEAFTQSRKKLCSVTHSIPARAHYDREVRRGDLDKGK